MEWRWTSTISRRARKPPQIQLGEDISALSAHELEARIARLEEEIARCKDSDRIAPCHQIGGGEFLQALNRQLMLICTS